MMAVHHLPYHSVAEQISGVAKARKIPHNPQVGGSSPPRPIIAGMGFPSAHSQRLMGFLMGCSKCGLDEPETTFNPSLPTICAPCHRQTLRAYYAANKAYFQARDKKRHRAKKAARETVLRALAAGKIKRLPCAECGAEDTEAHHTSYAKDRRLDVVWLCRLHHAQHHAKAA